MSTTLAAFLKPHGFRRPHPAALLREASVIPEIGRYAVRSVERSRERRATPYALRAPIRSSEPVILVPGFLAGDGTLNLMARFLRAEGFRTYRSLIHANVGCTLGAADQLERRLESVATRRGSRVQIVGHSLGGMIARGVAVRRPDLVSGVITMGSPTLAPGAHHISLTAGVDLLTRLNRAGMRGLMSEDCVAGACARQGFEESQEPVQGDIALTTIYSRRDGVVDWRACIDPMGVAVEVAASHVGMAVDPRVMEQVLNALQSRPAASSLTEVDCGVGA